MKIDYEIKPSSKVNNMFYKNKKPIIAIALLINCATIVNLHMCEMNVRIIFCSSRLKKSKIGISKSLK